MKQLLKPTRTFISSTSSLVLFTVVIALAACSCKKEAVKKTVAFQAEFETISTIVQDGPPEKDLINGKGQGTPMGKASFVTNAQFDDNGLTGTIVTTTADGDKIFASISSKTAPDVDANGNITLHFNAVTTGGEGKFAGASGSFTGTAHESIYNTNGAASWDGTITY
jgi:hypothetical protein